MTMIRSEALGNAAATALEISVPEVLGRSSAIVRWIRASSLDPVPAWIFLYQTPAADVTPGSDPHGVSLFVPRLIGVQEMPVVIPVDRVFASVLSIFASSTSDGTGVPVTGVRVEVEWQRIS